VFSDVRFENGLKRLRIDSSGVGYVRMSGDSVRAVVSCLGYMDYSLTLRKGAVHTIVLLQDGQYIPGAVVLDQLRPGKLEKSISNVTVIDRKTIDQMAAADLTDVISRQLNIRISRDNSLGSSNISLMGISGQNIKIMVDGIPVNGRLFDQLDLSQLNLQDIERIEIVKGPMSIAYGTNALGGAINLITKKYIDKPLSVNVRYLGESTGTQNINTTLAKRKKNAVYRLSLGRNMFTGWDANDTDRTFDWMPKRQYFGRFQYTRKIPNAEFQLRLDGMNEFMLDRGVPIQPYEESAVDQHFVTNRFDQSLSYHRKFNTKNDLQLLFANNLFLRNKNKYFTDLTTLNSELFPEPREQDTQTYHSQTVRVIYTFIPSSKWSVQAGIDGLREEVSGPRILDRVQQQIDGGLFLTGVIVPLARLQVKPSVRFNYNSVFDAVPVYQLQTRWALTSAITFKASAATGFRAPSVKELYLNFVDNSHNVVGNNELKAETSEHWRFSADWSIPTQGKANFKPEVELFQNTINNQIQLVATDVISAQYQNIGSFESRGFNLNLPVYHPSWRGNLSYSRIWINNGLLENSEEASMNPSDEVTFNFSYSFRNWVFASFVKHQGKRILVGLSEDDQLTEFEQQGFQFVDLSIARNKLWKNRFNLAAGIKNILNVTTINTQFTGGGAHSSGTNQLAVANGRQFFIQCSLNLQKQ
jgi:outer membrane receptor for ferrienterochelin and colicins